MALKDIKAKIGATKRMHTVTRAMEAVSAVKMRKTQSQAFSSRPYARAALSILTRIAGTSGVIDAVLSKERPIRKIALVIITSDRGLAGSLNSGVLREAMRAASQYAPEQVAVYAYGRKGEEFFRRRGYEIVEVHENKEDELPVARVSHLAHALTNGFKEEQFDQVIAVYSNFRSTFEQVPTSRTLLPLSLPALTSLVRDILPAKGKWSSESDLTAPATYDVETSGDAELMDVLLPKLVTASLYFMMSEAKASEHSARMVAMKNASDKSKDVTRSLTRTFNKVRQAQITREVSEIVGGREALSV